MRQLLQSIAPLLIIVVVAIISPSFSRRPFDRTFTGFFSKLMKIDTTSISCEVNTPALLYAFQSDSASSASNKQFLYGLIKCPSSFNQSLFNYTNKLTVYYKECTRDDLKNVIVLNRQKFFNVRYYLITAIQTAE
jgi:hypothetical protein